MESATTIVGPWRNIEVSNWTANPGFQFTGNETPDPTGGRGYELISATAVSASMMVEWMFDPETGRLRADAEWQFNELKNTVIAKGLSGDDEAIGSNAADIIRLEHGDDKVFARGGDDTIDGGDGNDVLHGQEGSDTIIGGKGSDNIDGGEGADIVGLNGFNGATFGLVRYGGTTYAMDGSDRSTDTIVETEAFQSSNRSLSLADVPTFDPLEYAASYNDLASAFRLNADALVAHYVAHGFFEGRDADNFDAAQYLKNYADLAGAFGDDLAAATSHFITRGVDEHRLADDPLDYIASYSDLVAAFQGQSQEQLTASGLAHYQAHGFDEGRRGGIAFDAKQYLANYSDLQTAFGADDDAAAAHFINRGSAETRMWQNPLDYIASYGDLIQAFHGGSDDQLRASGVSHYSANGFVEGRGTGIDFDVEQYLGNYADLRDAFTDGHGGYNDEAATLHLIQHGYFEGRTDGILIL